MHFFLWKSNAKMSFKSKKQDMNIKILPKLKITKNSISNNLEDESISGRCNGLTFTQNEK